MTRVIVGERHPNSLDQLFMLLLFISVVLMQIIVFTNSDLVIEGIWTINAVMSFAHCYSVFDYIATRALAIRTPSIAPWKRNNFDIISKDFEDRRFLHSQHERVPKVVGYLH